MVAIKILDSKKKAMQVRKRNGTSEDVSLNKIQNRIRNLSRDLKTVDATQIAVRVIKGLYNNVPTSELDILTAEIASGMNTIHPDFEKLASRVYISNLHKNTNTYFDNLLVLHKNGQISQECYDISLEYKTRILEAIDYDNDYKYTYFAIKTLERSYLFRNKDGSLLERPQDMLMRVAIGIHGRKINDILSTYRMMSTQQATHASPTLFNAGTNSPQMSSCFLLQVQEDSLDGIYNTLHQCARISKSAGGIGVSISNVRCRGSDINGTQGKSDGIVPMLKVYNDTACYINQGGRRKGAIAVYLEPWHADIVEFLELKRNHGAEEFRARDLFYGMWIPDLFMRRVQNDHIWSLMCPNQCPGLQDVYGKKFDELYTQYEAKKMFVRQVKAREIWKVILTSQIETGTPYMLYKDSVNAKSNQKNIGTIRSSNLCTEIVEYVSPKEIAVCNLASIALNRCVVDGVYNYQLLYDICYKLVHNLNDIIDRNMYPVVESKQSNCRHRPIGIGVQGLADTFFMLRHPFDSKEASQINRNIFETMYYAALRASCDLARKYGPYESYKGSPISKGILQFDMWKTQPTFRQWDWKFLRKDIQRYGVRNSLLIAPMPTASTSQILGNNECIEPISSNIYVRRTMAGEFTCVNKYLQEDLLQLGLWNNTLKDRIIAARGSIQHIPEIPTDIKNLYKTVWELSAKTILDMAKERSPFIDQSQSLNIFLKNPSYAQLTSMHFYGWQAGLKTGMYYLRSQPATNPIQFSIDQNLECTSCGS